MPQKESELSEKRLTVNLSPEVYDQVLVLAARERRTASQLVKIWIEDHVEAARTEAVDAVTAKLVAADAKRKRR